MNVKTRKNLMLAAAIVIVFNFNSCKKYEDGPLISLKTKTARLVGEWEVKDTESPDFNEFIDWGFDISFEFEKDGDCSMTFEYGTYSYTYKGEWEWQDSKGVVEVDFPSDQYLDLDQELEIMRLTDEELWFEDEEGDLWEAEKK